jgi:hypothetical protein
MPEDSTDIGIRQGEFGGFAFRAIWKIAVQYGESAGDLGMLL